MTGFWNSIGSFFSSSHAAPESFPRYSRCFGFVFGIRRQYAQPAPAFSTSYPRGQGGFGGRLLQRSGVAFVVFAIPGFFAPTNRSLGAGAAGRTGSTTRIGRGSSRR
jgi:hypothetical protein